MLSYKIRIITALLCPVICTASTIIENKGQVRQDSNSSEKILFYTQVDGGYAYFLEDRISFVLTKITSTETNNDVKAGSRKSVFRYDMKLPKMLISTGAPLKERINFYQGKSSYSAAQYQQVIYRNEQKGVSLFFYDHPGKGMKYDIVFDHPEKGAADFSFKLEGAEALKTKDPRTGKEMLSIVTPLGNVQEHFPVCYMEVHAKNKMIRQETSCSISIAERQITYKIEIPESCSSAVIDPWISFAGGSGVDECYGTAADEMGNIYISGHTLSTDFPSSPGSFQTAINANYDAYIFKFDPSGQRLWATYYGGSMDDFGYRIKVSPSGKPTLSGYTYSNDLYVSSSGVFSSAFSGLIDAFIAQFDASGNFSWGTYAGGTGGDFAIAMDMDKLGFIALAGFTSSNDFPVSPSAWQSAFGGALDCFIAKFDSTGNRVWATYMGGLNSEDAHAVKFDSFGNVIIAGDTYSTNFPVSASAYQNFLVGGGDAYVAKFNSSGNNVWSTYLGGTGNEDIEALASDAGNNIYFTGYSTSTDLPVTAGAFQSSMNGVRDLAAGSFSSSGALKWLTYAGGTAWDMGRGIIVNTNSKITICGETNSTDFPVEGNTYDTIHNGVSDILYMTLDTTGTVELANFRGGSSADVAHDICEVTEDKIAISGNTYSTDFPVTPGVFQEIQAGDVDAFAWLIDTASIITFISPEKEEIGSFVYPNPGNGTAFITNLLPANYLLSIFDSQGKLLSEEIIDANSGKAIIENVKHCKPGVYLIRLHSDKKQYDFRLVRTW